MPGGLPCHPLPPVIMSGVCPLFSRGMLGNFVDQNVALSMEYFVITTHLVLFLTPDTHTIYEDNCKARRAPAEPSLMDRKAEMGENVKKWEERESRRAERERDSLKQNLMKSLCFFASLDFNLSRAQNMSLWSRSLWQEGIHGVLLSTASGKETWDSKDFDSLCEREWQSNAWMFVCKGVGG